jgi:acyl transferase domain-containing protein/NADPH:quinone reductase-like Zn-dependent oxidoreductase/thioester reductase-like protein/acyl carrier protein
MILVFPFQMIQLNCYDSHLFNIQGKVSRNMHLQQLGVLQSVFQGLEDAGIPLHEIYRTRTGVFVAAYTAFLPACDGPDETLLRGQIMSSLADQVSYFLGTYGPSITLETACSSSLVAIAMAVASLQQGDCDTALVTGLNYLNEKDFHLSLQACGVMVQGPTSHPFDEDGAKGYIRGEGMGTVVLRRLVDAEQHGDRILCKVLRAIAASAGPADNALEGPGRVYEQPCPYGMREMFSRVYKCANVPLEKLHYMECHATGTAVGDVIELQAIGDVFGDSHELRKNPLRIASVKSNIGHAEVAAGIFSVIKIVQMMKHRTFLPSAGVTCPRKDFEWVKHNMVIQQECEPFPDNEPVTVGVNSFGIGGAYGHVVMQEYKKVEPVRRAVLTSASSLWALPAEDAAAKGLVFPLSAVSMPHLQLFADRMAKYIKERGPAISLKDLCATMWIHRSRFQYRKSFVASTTQELAEKLAAFASSGNTEPSGEGRKMQVAYVFTGQGSQWPGVGKTLMAFPVYRKAVKAADKLFKSKSGWSILEKIDTLSADEMRDTLYAQPISFLVQVGLYELLKFFKVFPDVVVGHSAGEVAAAYASGLLTLEEACEVVYHRSAEQQKMAGCGRLMAVGLSEEKIQDIIRGMADVEIACVNSPESVVLASSEERLKEVGELLPEGTQKAMVPGNIAFHSSRVEPILPAMKARLAFLDKRPKTWGLPYVSAVTGKLESKLDSNYWVDNVRRPVLFQKAIETIFSQDTCPDIVIEIGPHKTLCSPIAQVLSALGKSATVLCPLKRNDTCSLRFLESLGQVFEKGLMVDCKAWYQDLGYNFEEDLPKHPFIKKRLHEMHPVLKNDMRNGVYIDGPVAGVQKFFDGAYVSEVSDRTYKQMCDHKMGGQAIFPGMFFVEMVLEAVKGAPITLTNVEFKSMLKIPSASSGENPSLVALNFAEEQDGIRSFVVRSCPTREKWDEEPVLVEHCTGKVIKTDLFQEDGSIRSGFKPEAYGLLADINLKDIGEDGLKNLIGRHTQCEHSSTENFYGTHCVEGQMEYLESFQLVESVHVDPKTMSILGKLNYDNEAWEKKGGIFGVQLLDALLHQTLILATHSAIYYAGGFDACHFLRQPATKELYVYFTLDKYRLQIGRKKKVGDFALYDGTGQLVLFMQGFFTVFASFTDNYKLCDLLWQPFAAPEMTTEAALHAYAKEALTHTEAWTAADNDRLTSWLIEQLRANGALELPAPAVEDAKPKKGKGKEAVPLVRKVLEALEARMSEIQESTEESKKSVALPTIAKLDERASELIKALVAKIKEEKEAAKPVTEADDEDADESDFVQITAEEMKELTSAAIQLPAETLAVATSLKMQAEKQQQLLGHNYVFRVFEIAQEATETVVEAFSRLDLPSNIIVEYFVGSHNAGLLKSLATKVNRKATNVRLRRVLINDTLFNELKDITFEAVVFDEWTRSGAAAFMEGKLEAPVANAVEAVRSFMMPGAPIYVRGLNNIPLWTALTSLVSATPLPLTNALPAEEALAEWTQLFLVQGEVHQVKVGAGTLLMGRLTVPAPAAPARYLLVVDEQGEGEEMLRRMQALNPAAEAEIILVGEKGKMTDKSTSDDYATLIAELLAPNKVEEVSEATSAVPAEEESEEPVASPFKGVVFSAGLNDSSVIGDVAFSRLLKLGQALLKNGDLLKSLRENEVAEPASLWVVTKGAYVGELHPAQGSVQGMATVLCGELHDMVTKHVDLASSSGKDLAALAELVLADAREKSYTVVEGVAQVARFNAIDKTDARALQVSATDKLCYYADIKSAASVPGEIGVTFQLRDVPAPKENEVQIDIHAAALNFRDVMIALSLLPEKSYERSYYGRNLGLEASGVVTAVGKDVTDLQVGDRVMTGEPCCFANRLNAPASRVVKLDQRVPFEDAASLQSVYNTSHHALINLARIRKGETVLIHSAAGGIGHAAISIAKHVGAVIHATAGTDEKRQLVKDMGVEFVYNSRNVGWFDDLMRDTNGQGVDVVLNSLAGKHQRLGVQALRSSGRFLEIGKMDIFDNNGLPLLAFRKNISFFAIDMDRLALDDPAQTAEIGREVGMHFMEGHYDKLPIVTFPMNEIKEALEFMKTGKHVGKVVLTNYLEDKKTGKVSPCSVTVEKPQNIFHADATYLVTGGAGGFGSKLVRYAYYNGARSFLITTRSADTERVRGLFRDILDDASVKMEVMTVDTGSEADMKKLTDRAHEISPPVKSIFHVAGVSVDIVLPEMKPEDFYEVANCKALGAWHLHKGTLDLPIENFVVVSSIASLIGGLGMSSYASSNAYLDALMRARRSQGLPGAAFNMSSLSDVGILANNLSARKFQLKMGVEYITSFRALQELEMGLVAGMNPIITMFFKEKTRTMFPFQSPWSYHLGEALTLGAVAAKGDFMTTKEIAHFLSEEIKEITGASEVLITSQLVTLGLDSFGFVELGGRIKKHFGIEVSSVKMSPDNTLEDVSKIIYKLQSRGSSDKKGGETEGEDANQEGMMVLHNKAEMNSMITTLFEDGEKLVVQPLKRGNMSLSSLGSGAKLLFGATGLTGAHLLRYLIKAGIPKVFCVVRGATAEGGLARIEKAMRLLKIWKPSFAAHIVALPGDMASPNFGLKPELYARLVLEVDAVVHAGGSRKWHMDTESVACNISGLMNIITLARKNNASVHYVSSGWLDAEEAATDKDREVLRAMPYVQIKRRAEDILHFAARHYKLNCLAYRIPLISVNTKGGFTGDFVAFSVMQTLSESHMMPKEMCEKSCYPIMPADMAAKYIVRQMSRAPRKTNGHALLYSAAAYSEIISTQKLGEWVEELQGIKIDRLASMDNMKEYYRKRLVPQVLDMQASFTDFLAALGRASERLRQQVRRESTVRNLVDKALFYNPKVLPSELLKEYVRDHPEVLLMEQAWFKDEDEEEEEDAGAHPEADLGDKQVNGIITEEALGHQLVR